MEISEKQNKATGEIVDLIANSIGRKREVHPATAISTSARLSGAFLFKSFGLNIENIKPGTAVLSVQANEEGPELINVMRLVLLNLGLTIDNENINSAEIQKSELDLLQSLNATQTEATEIKKRHGLNDKEMAIACAASTAFIIQQCRNDLKAEFAFATAVYGLIEGSKTVPPRTVTSKTFKKSWYKFW